VHRGDPPQRRPRTAGGAWHIVLNAARGLTACGSDGILLLIGRGNVTELLYLRDSYIREFDAVVRRVADDRVVLDRTAFYPRGGGQPWDTGVLEAPGDASFDVTEVQRHDGEVWHTVPGHVLRPGDAVHGRIDWPRRHALMRTHTTLHALSAVIWRDHGAKVTGGNMEPLRGRLDFELAQLPEGFNEALERTLNQELSVERDIQVRFLTRDEASQVPDLIRTKVNLLPADITEIRTVEIVDLDLQADGGTHVANTREVGPVRIVKTENKGKGFKRVRVELQDLPEPQQA
jgi:misacylated tRNA(Ala) deacylase